MNSFIPSLRKVCLSEYHLRIFANPFVNGACTLALPNSDMFANTGDGYGEGWLCESFDRPTQNLRPHRRMRSMASTWIGSLRTKRVDGDADRPGLQQMLDFFREGDTLSLSPSAESPVDDETSCRSSRGWRQGLWLRVAEGEHRHLVPAGTLRPDCVRCPCPA